MNSSSPELPPATRLPPVSGEDDPSSARMFLETLAGARSSSRTRDVLTRGEPFARWVAAVALAAIGESVPETPPFAEVRDPVTRREVVGPVWETMRSCFETHRPGDSGLYLLDPVDHGLDTGVEVEAGDSIEVRLAGVARVSAEGSGDLAFTPGSLWVAVRVGDQEEILGTGERVVWDAFNAHREEVRFEDLYHFRCGSSGRVWLRSGLREDWAYEVRGGARITQAMSRRGLVVVQVRIRRRGAESPKGP